MPGGGCVGARNPANAIIHTELGIPHQGTPALSFHTPDVMEVVTGFRLLPRTGDDGAPCSGTGRIPCDPGATPGITAELSGDHRTPALAFSSRTSRV